MMTHRQPHSSPDAPSPLINMKSSFFECSHCRKQYRQPHAFNRHQEQCQRRFTERASLVALARSIRMRCERDCAEALADYNAIVNGHTCSPQPPQQHSHQASTIQESQTHHHWPAAVPHAAPTKNARAPPAAHHSSHHHERRENKNCIAAAEAVRAAVAEEEGPPEGGTA